MQNIKVSLYHFLFVFLGLFILATIINMARPIFFIIPFSYPIILILGFWFIITKMSGRILIKFNSTTYNPIIVAGISLFLYILLNFLTITLINQKFIHGFLDIVALSCYLIYFISSYIILKKTVAPTLTQ